ncbi:MAG TPA: outer membrane beta-barrel protein [Chitinophagaceae bacterium]|nr:outer membrane beta-barrel protein [Chitinophagaceae bacterium]
MKKALLFTSLALLACWSSKAQPANGARRTQYGIYAQLGHSRMSDGLFYSPVVMRDSRSLYSLGLSLRHRLSARWTLSSGVALNYKKYAVMGEQLQDPSHPAYNPSDELGWNCMPIRQNMLYAYNTQVGVEIPLLMQYHIVKDRFFVSSGIEVNAGMYVRYKAAHQAYDQSITIIDKAQAINAYQLMLPFGLGVNIPAGRHQISIEPGIKFLATGYRDPDYFLGLYTLKTSFYF